MINPSYVPLFQQVGQEFSLYEIAKSFDFGLNY